MKGEEMPRKRKAADPAPQRLSKQDYLLQQSSPVRIYHQFIHEQVDVHWHEFYEIHYTLAGKGTHLLNEITRELRAGTLFCMTPTDFHAVIPSHEQPLELFNVIFTEEQLSTELRSLLFSTSRELAVQVDEASRPEIEREFRRIWHESEQQQPGYGLVMRGALERILIDLRRMIVVGQTSSITREDESAISPVIRQALIYMEHHFREALPLAEVAQHVGLSSHYFSECFHRLVGQTFQCYLQSLRLQFAQALLAASQLPITTICSSAGFHSLTHFERLFKQRYGLTPRAYRQHYGKTELV
ncbi:AraC family transcriptional regulator [Reticulibacter mediterranei]|uniref:AraC family transcriptional regulator n=2 Tax=Reticulibacter mediterranei TaxID=2778369 RepID=A0A8J3IYZ5_9CHLR|nr:AraC family transcriptional regulator [Reticulibacter mediterranei]